MRTLMDFAGRDLDTTLAQVSERDGGLAVGFGIAVRWTASAPAAECRQRTEPTLSLQGGEGSAAPGEAFLQLFTRFLMGLDCCSSRVEPRRSKLLLSGIGGELALAVILSRLWLPRRTEVQDSEATAVLDSGCLDLAPRP